MNKKTILFLAANPINTERLRLDIEAREIDEGLKRAKHRERYILHQRWALRTDDLRRAMLDIEPDIVHFSGHGTEQNGIILEDESGSPAFVSGHVLRDFFGLFPKVECVVLNACYSEHQAIAIAKNVKYVVGIQQKIDDLSAKVFATSFYDAIGAGKSIEFAYKLGCNALQMSSIHNELLPTFLAQGLILDREIENTCDDSKDYQKKISAFSHLNLSSDSLMQSNLTYRQRMRWLLISAGLAVAFALTGTLLQNLHGQSPLSSFMVIPFFGFTLVGVFIIIHQGVIVTKRKQPSNEASPLDSLKRFSWFTANVVLAMSAAAIGSVQSTNNTLSVLTLLLFSICSLICLYMLLREVAAVMAGLIRSFR